MAKASSSCLACNLDTTSRYTFGNVVSTTHQRNEHHALTVQARLSTASLLRIINGNVCWRFVPSSSFTAPIAHAKPTTKHQSVDIFAQNSINDFFTLQKRTLSLRLAGGHV